MDVRTRLEQALGSAYSIDRELTGGGMSHGLRNAAARANI